MEEANDAITNMKASLSGLSNTLSIELAPSITAMANAITDTLIPALSELGRATSNTKLVLPTQGISDPTNKIINDAKLADERKAKAAQGKDLLGGMFDAGLATKPFSMVPETPDNIKAAQGGDYLSGVFSSVLGTEDKTKPFNMTSDASLGMQESVNTANQWADLLAQAEPYLSKAKVVNDDITDGMAEQLELQKEKNREEAGFTLTKAGRLAMTSPGVDNGGIKGAEAWTADKVNEELALLKQIAKGTTQTAVLA